MASQALMARPRHADPQLGTGGASRPDDDTDYKYACVCFHGHEGSSHVVFCPKLPDLPKQIASVLTRLSVAIPDCAVKFIGSGDPPYSMTAHDDVHQEEMKRLQVTEVVRKILKEVSRAQGCICMSDVTCGDVDACSVLGSEAWAESDGVPIFNFIDPTTEHEMINTIWRQSVALTPEAVKHTQVLPLGAVTAGGGQHGWCCPKATVIFIASPGNRHDGRQFSLKSCFPNMAYVVINGQQPAHCVRESLQSAQPSPVLILKDTGGLATYMGAVIDHLNDDPSVPSDELHRGCLQDVNSNQHGCANPALLREIQLEARKDTKTFNTAICIESAAEPVQAVDALVHSFLALSKPPALDDYERKTVCAFWSHHQNFHIKARSLSTHMDILTSIVWGSSFAAMCASVWKMHIDNALSEDEHMGVASGNCTVASAILVTGVVVPTYCSRHFVSKILGHIVVLCGIIAAYVAKALHGNQVGGEYQKTCVARAGLAREIFKFMVLGETHSSFEKFHETQLRIIGVSLLPEENKVSQDQLGAYIQKGPYEGTEPNLLNWFWQSCCRSQREAQEQADNQPCCKSQRDVRTLLNWFWQSCCRSQCEAQEQADSQPCCKSQRDVRTSTPRRTTTIQSTWSQVQADNSWDGMEFLTIENYVRIRLLTLLTVFNQEALKATEQQQLADNVFLLLEGGCVPLAGIVGWVSAVPFLVAAGGLLKQWSNYRGGHERARTLAEVWQELDNARARWDLHSPLWKNTIKEKKDFVTKIEDLVYMAETRFLKVPTCSGGQVALPPAQRPRIGRHGSMV